MDESWLLYSAGAARCRYELQGSYTGVVDAGCQPAKDRQQHHSIWALFSPLVTFSY